MWSSISDRRQTGRFFRFARFFDHRKSSALLLPCGSGLLGEGWCSAKACSARSGPAETSAVI